MCRRFGQLLAFVIGIALMSCDENDATIASTPAARVVSMDYASVRFYDAPFPGEHLRGEDGHIDLSRAPSPSRISFVTQIHEALREFDGFGTSSPIHFHLDGEIERAALPDAFSSLDPNAPILLIDVDPDSIERGSLHSFATYFRSDAGPYGDTFFLTLVPTQGLPLKPNTRYAAIVTTDLRGADGFPLEPSSAMISLLEGRVPEGMNDPTHAAFMNALTQLEDTLDLHRIAGMTVFRTGDPHATLRRAVEATEGREVPSPAVPPSPSEQFESYCVFEGSIRMPVFQEGTPPYSSEGGQWRLDTTGAPLLTREEEARIVFTIPRQAMPTSGFPTVMFVRTGAGGDRPLVDRGARNAMGEAMGAGMGPALEFARAGFAGVSVEGPHGGSRNVSGGDEQFLVFNIQNPIALRDNLRQSALELVLLARALDEMTIDAASCPGFSAPSGDDVVRFDTHHLAIMGHSMGASIAPLAAAFEPRLRALVLSGAGGSWIENILHKERPLRTRVLAEALLRYSSRGHRLDADDPVLGLLQWAGESADAQIYGPTLVGSHHVLMFQGIVDHYILPPIANALSLSLSLDLAGPALDTNLFEYTPLADLLPLRRRDVIALPAAGNVISMDGASITAVVTQHPEDGIEDGHETVFQTEAPKAQYRCFLRTFARDQVPVVPDPNASSHDCSFER